MSKMTSRDVFELLKLLRIDVFFFLATVASSLPNIALNQLIQDKFCLNQYNVNESICFNLESSGEEFDSVRNDILKETTTLKMYITILTTIPTIITSLFMGYWIDTYPGHLRYLLAVSGVSIICQNIMVIYQSINFELDPYWILVTYLFPILTGSSTMITIGTFTYATQKTPAKFRVVRFTVLEICLFGSMPIASSFGGALLSANPWFSDQFRNYVGVYLISSIIAVAASIWVALLLYDADKDNDKHSNSNETPTNTAETSNLNNDANRENNKKTLKQIVFDIIKLDNILHASRCVFTKRQNNAHWYLIATIISGFISNVSYQGEQNIGYQFNQRVYHWNASQIGYYSSIVIIFPALGAVLGPPLFIHKMNLHDSAVMIIGIVSLMFGFFAKGIILSPAAFFMTIFASFAGVVFVVDRSIISRMIKSDEIAQVYAFSAAVGGFIPTASSFFYTKLFAATIDSNPGLVYIFAASLFIFPLINAIVLNIKKDKWDLVIIAEKQKQDNKIELSASDVTE